MQPENPLPQDIKTLADWLYDQFRATDPVEVKNILETPYKFKYCVGETIETPDQVSRKVIERQYEEYMLAPGETKVMMGAAAYIFIDGVARTYLYKHVTEAAKVPLDKGGMGLDHMKAEEQGANATADVAQLVEAAKLAFIGTVGYANHSQAPVTPQRPIAPIKEPDAPAGHNPNSVSDDNGDMPNLNGAGTETTTEDDAFANLGGEIEHLSVVPATDSEDGNAHFFVDGEEVDNKTYNEAARAAKANA